MARTKRTEEAAQIVCWRDIPAQVIVGRGPQRQTIALSERFQQAIDRAAMRSGARDTDTYLADWNRVSAASLVRVAGTGTATAADIAAALEDGFPDDVLKSLVANGGRQPDGVAP